MIELAADNLFASLSNIALFGAKMREALDDCAVSDQPDIVISDPKPFFLLQASLQVIEEQAGKIDMPVTIAAVWRCKHINGQFKNYGSGLIIERGLLQNQVEYLYTLTQVVSDEIKSHLMFVMSSKHAAFYADSAHFTEAVEEAFPSVIYDVCEAAKCRALGRWTACVMHIMRVLEIGLAALAKHLNVAEAGNWNTVLNQIESKAREIGKRTHGKEAEQWAAEAGTHLRFIKNAWRNHAMHPLEKYDEERAVVIFDNARSFMRHLSTLLSE